ncbi:MbcA/ParS/Xre antitoxin family protein [Luteibacter aegosomaticola]|uniref:antitoxin Xre/MbcA/ParS toxin-binding domain-containing protein n=1 Tax=Luteibacter aegosomaticola TaxID=2911538 RepID=UPI001FF8A25F|nr:antitoxin Xre/MbcA/ParS toxin-binding domain-containing protein [Luteibacter aegosomaticola]UPG92055.1 MbcA/ParS/Xre antitoxin family protein [Luteibacter aegosomaticola]
MPNAQPQPSPTFAALSSELTRLHDAREAAIGRALDTLETSHPPLAQLMLCCIGDRQRAARWLVMPQRAFAGRSACDMLADGDVDAVWDQVVYKEFGAVAAL